MNKNGSIFGLVLGIISIFGAFLVEGGTLGALFLIPPIIVVFGGTFAAVIIGFGFEQFKKIGKLVKIAYSQQEYAILSMIDMFVEIAQKGRKDGLLSVEKDVQRLNHFFPQKMMHFLLDGTNAETLEIIAGSEMRALKARHESNIFMLNKMGGYAPTMGIIGTVMGLIMTLAKAGDDPNILIHNIASAFIATLWGIFTANIIWLPIADKLKQCHLKEIHMMEVSLEAVLALQAGEIPTIIKSRLISMMPQKDQKEVLKRN